MRAALRSRSTSLIVAAVLAGGAGGLAIGRATDDSTTTVDGQPSAQAAALRDFIRRAGEVDGARPIAEAARPKPVPRRLLDCVIDHPDPSAAAMRSLPSRCRGRVIVVPPPPRPTTIEAPAVLREALNEGRIHEDQDPDTYPPDVKRAIREYEAQKKAQ